MRTVESGTAGVGCIRMMRRRPDQDLIGRLFTYDNEERFCLGGAAHEPGAKRKLARAARVSQKRSSLSYTYIIDIMCLDIQCFHG